MDPDALTISIGVLIVGGICIQLVLAFYRTRTVGTAYDPSDDDIEIATSDLKEKLYEDEYAGAETPRTMLSASSDASQMRALRSNTTSPMSVRFADENTPASSISSPRTRSQLKSVTATPNKKRELLPMPNGVTHPMRTPRTTLYAPNGTISSLWNQSPDSSALRSLPLVDGSADGPEVLVNAKQYDRILKRRIARQLLDQYFGFRTKQPQESNERQTRNACMRRPRGKGGRFLQPDKIHVNGTATAAG